MPNSHFSTFAIALCYNQDISFWDAFITYTNLGFPEIISIAADLRKATVNDIFNANTKSRIITLIAIVESLGFTMNVFGKIYDDVTEKDIADFQFIRKNKEKQKGNEDLIACVSFQLVPINKIINSNNFILRNLIFNLYKKCE